jgi:NifU-like protein involved in Fe-S cluster formation
MDQAVIKYYRQLLRNGFANAGSIQNPSIFLDSVGENLPICGRMGQDYVHVFLNIQEGVISDIKYLCNCDPTANVVFEIMCGLLKGLEITDFEKLDSEQFSEIVGTREEEFLKRVKGSMELIRRGLQRFENSAVKEAAGN